MNGKTGLISSVSPISNQKLVAKKGIDEIDEKKSRIEKKEIYYAPLGIASASEDEEKRSCDQKGLKTEHVENERNEEKTCKINHNQIKCQ